MSRLRHWFIPSPSGDLRLEEVPDLDTLSANDARRTWPAHPPGGCVLDVLNPTPLEVATVLRAIVRLTAGGHVIGAPSKLGPGQNITALSCPVEVAARILVEEHCGVETVWTAYRKTDGTVALKDSDAPVPDEAVAAASLKPPSRGCPPPTSAERRASEVLRVFSTRRQHDSFQAHGFMDVIGNATGKRYRLHHRDEAHQRGLSRVLIDTTTGNPVCVWDNTVPPEEEVLAIKLAVEHREKWLHFGDLPLTDLTMASDRTTVRRRHRGLSA